MVEEPIEIRDLSKHSDYTSRQSHLAENNRKIGGSNKFSFRKFKTDKEKLEEYTQKKLEEDIYKEKIKQYAEIKDKQDARKLNTIQQPTMRFKPRTDLERIYYTVNSYSMGKISKQIVSDHLEKLNLYNFKKIDEEESLNLADNLENKKHFDEEEIEELLKQRDFLNKQGYDEKNSDTVKQIEEILGNFNRNKIQLGDMRTNENNISKTNQKHSNNAAAIKKLNKDFNLNNKTFFKAASVYSFKLDEYKKNLRKSELKNPYDKKILKENSDESSNFNKNSDYENNINNNNNSINKSKFNSTMYCKSKDRNIRNNNNSNNFEQKKNDNQKCFLDFDKIDEPNKTEEDFPEDVIYDNNNFNNYIGNKNNPKNHYRNLSENFSYNNNNIINESFNNTANMSSNFFNPNQNYIQKQENNNIDIEKLQYLKKISASGALPNWETSGNNFKIKEFPNTFSEFLNTKNNHFNKKRTSSKNFKENIFVKASFVKDEENKKCKIFLLIFLLNIKYIVDEEKININNQVIQKSQINEISKNVLTRCNYLNKKSEFNDKNLKAKDGKLMITSGLTVYEFNKKYNFPL